jgi:hypothetical protein
MPRSYIIHSPVGTFLGVAVEGHLSDNEALELFDTRLTNIHRGRFVIRECRLISSQKGQPYTYFSPPGPIDIAMAEHLDGADETVYCFRDDDGFLVPLLEEEAELLDYDISRAEKTLPLWRLAIMRNMAGL